MQFTWIEDVKCQIFVYFDWLCNLDEGTAFANRNKRVLQSHSFGFELKKVEEPTCYDLNPYIFRATRREGPPSTSCGSAMIHIVNTFDTGVGLVLIKNMR